jgi:hypothetical protein
MQNYRRMFRSGCPISPLKKLKQSIYSSSLLKGTSGLGSELGESQPGDLLHWWQWQPLVTISRSFGLECYTSWECAKMWLQRVSALTFIGLCGVIGFWGQDRSPPITVKQETVQVSLQEGYIRVAYDIERHRQCSLTLEQLLYDGQGDRLPIEPVYFPIAPGPTGPDRFGIKITVPKGFAPGQARYRAIRLYYCNPVQRLLNWPIVLNVPDVEFAYSGG